MKWEAHVVSIGEIRHAKNILISKPEGKRHFGMSGKVNIFLHPMTEPEVPKLYMFRLLILKHFMHFVSLF
jgi:hypothetical protein